MEEDYIDQLYTSLGGDKSGIDKNAFRKDISTNKEYNRQIYDYLGGDKAGIDYNAFLKDTFQVSKKKEPTQPTSASTSAATSSAGQKNAIDPQYAKYLSDTVGKSAKRVSGLTIPKTEVKPIGDISQGDVAIDTSKPVSESQPQVDDRNVIQKGVDSIVEAITSGTTQVASGIAGLIGGAADVLIDKNPDTDTPASPFTNKWFYNLVSQKGEIENPAWFSTQGIRDAFMGLSNSLAEISQKESQIAKADLGVKDPTKQAIDQILEGNYVDGVKSTIVEVIQILPQIGFMATGGQVLGFATMGATSAGSSLREQYSQDRDISATDLSQALSIGVVETVAGKAFDLDIKGLTTIGGAIGDYLGASGKALKNKIASEGADAVKRDLIRTVGDIGKEASIGAGQNVIEENIVNIFDYLITAIDEDNFNEEGFNKLIKDMGQSTVVSLASGGAISGLAAKVSQVPLTADEKRTISKLEEIVNDPKISSQTKKIAEGKIREIKTSVDEKSAENYAKISELPLEDRVELLNKQDAIRRLEEDKKLSQDVDINDAIDERIGQLQGEIDEIINKPKSEESSITLVDEVSGLSTTIKQNKVGEELVIPKESLSDIEASISDAKKFQPEAVKLISIPEVGDTATNSKIGVVDVVSIDGDTATVKYNNKRGKEATKDVSLSDLYLDDSQIADKYNSGRSEEFNNKVEEIIRKDIYDEGINKQRAAIAKVEESPFRKIFNNKYMPDFVKNAYNKLFTAGNIAYVRAMESADALSGLKKDKLSIISKDLAKKIEKSPQLRESANIVLSKNNIDDKLDLLKSITKEEAMASLSGVNLDDIRLAMQNPESESSIETMDSVYAAISPQTKNGTRSEINQLINDTSISSQRGAEVRKLGAEWLNYKPQSEPSGRSISDIESDILNLPNGESILDELNKSVEATVAAEAELMKTKEGQSLLNTVNSAREMVDSYAEWVDSNVAAIGIKDKDLGDSIMNNVGFYLKKTYDYWKNKDFTFDEAHSEAAIASAVKSILPHKLLQISQTKAYREATESQRSKMVKKQIDKIEESVRKNFAEYISDITKAKEYKPQNVYPNSAKVESKNTWKREIINEEFGKVLGKSEDAIDRLHATVMAQTQVQAAAQASMMLNELAGDSFFNSKDEAIKSLMDSGMTATEAGVEIGKNYVEMNDPLSPLDGKMIPRDVYDSMFGEGFKINDIFMDWLKVATVTWRMGKTVFNPSGHINNVTGGHIGIFEQGHIVDDKTITFFLDRFRMMGGTNKLSDYAKEMKSIMVDNGLWNTSVSIGEINELLKNYKDISSPDKNVSYMAATRLKSFFNKTTGGVKRYYAASDDFTKLILFHKEKDTFAKKIYGKEYNDLTPKEKSKVHAETAERIKQNMPTMSRLPQASKWILKSVAIGDFQGFRFGAFSSVLNTFANASSDIMKGLLDKSLNKTQKAAYISDGVKKLVAQSTVAAFDMSFGGAIAGLAAKAVGTLSKDLFDDKEDDNGNNIGSKYDMYKKMPNQIFMPQWSVGQNLITVADDGKGNVSFVNLSNTIPNDEVYGLLFGRNNMDWGDSSTDIALETFSPNATLNLAMRALKGEDVYGRDIYPQDAHPIDKIWGIMTYLLSQYSIPTFKHMNKLASEYSKNQQGAAPEDWRIKDERQVQFGSYIKGLLVNSPQIIKRTYKVNIADQLFWNMKSDYKTLAKFSDINSDNRLLQNRLEHIKKYRDAYKVLREYEIKNNNPGFASKAIGKAFSGAKGISKEEKAYIITGSDEIFKIIMSNNKAKQ